MLVLVHLTTFTGSQSLASIMIFVYGCWSLLISPRGFITKSHFCHDNNFVLKGTSELQQCICLSLNALEVQTSPSYVRAVVIPCPNYAQNYAITIGLIRLNLITNFSAIT